MKKLTLLLRLTSILLCCLLPACKNESELNERETVDAPKTPATLDLTKYTWRDFIPEENLGNYRSADDNMTAYLHNCMVAILHIEADFGIEYNESYGTYWYPNTLKGDGTDTDEEIRATIKKYYTQLEQAEVWAQKFKVIYDKVKKKDGVFAASLVNPTYRVCKNLPSERVYTRWSPRKRAFEKEYYDLNHAYLKSHYNKIDEIRVNFRFGFDIRSIENLDYLEYHLNRAKGAPYTEFKGVR